MLGHVRGGEDDAAAEPASLPASRDGAVLANGGAGPVVACDGDGAVVADSGDGPDVAVAHPVPPGQGTEVPVVESRDDGVADASGGAVAQLDLTFGVQRLVEDQVGTGATVQRGHVFVGFGDQHRYQARVPVGAPCVVGRIGHGLGVAVGDALVGEIGVDSRRASMPKLK